MMQFVLPPAAADIDQQGKDRRSAERVVRLASEGVLALIEGFDANFSSVLDLLFHIKGRVVTTGMGKSGHIAQKIASTLSSTGTPAMFVHPGEASHGDLGMITVEDAVIALSNSGETPELGDIVAYTRRYAIPLIAMTREIRSTLAEAADLVLLVPGVPEACPMGLAPTTSTTAMVALGDAVAVALLERRGFTTSDFQVLHPGGSLGKKLLRVVDLMHAGNAVPLVSGTAEMSEIVLTMSAKRFGCVGLLSATNRLLGIITDGDLRRHMTPDLLNRDPTEIMTRNPVTIRPHALAAEALGLMHARSITSLFVVEDEQPVGIVHIHDCLEAGVD